MNNQLTKTFSPTNDQGGLDQRFNEDIRIIFQSIGGDVLAGLNNFLLKTSELERSHGGYAQKLCEAFYKRIKYLDEYEREGSNQHRWKSKMLKKTLHEGLANIGFKPSKVSKIIGATEFLSSIHPQHIHRKQIESMPIGSQYALSRMNETGISVALGNPFSNENPTKAKLEEIATKYPKNPFETRGRKPSFEMEVCKDDESSLAEILVEGDEVDDLIAAVKNLDLESVFIDDDKRSRLQVVAQELDCLADLSKPIPKRPVYV
tara:strand:+ start:132 stop:917 length:786 start_codon:yes stop_codon:yes gene_type:complete